MDTRRIGSLTVSAVGLGCNNFGWHIGEAASRSVVGAALDAGITHFDTADVYGDGASERFLGRALAGHRDEVVIATKFGNGTGARPAVVRQSVEASLQRLGTDCIDLYYLHKPDPATPLADTLGALAELVDAGKVREVACSNVGAGQLRQAEAAASGARFVAVQNEYSLLHREPEAEVLDACDALDLAFVPFFPLKSGLLTGKYRAGEVEVGGRLNATEGKFAGLGERLLTDATLATVEHLIGWAAERGHTILDLAFAYLLAQPSVASVIAGATTPAQIRSNVDAASWRLSPDALAALRAELA